jgi:hypothetical protein
MKETDAAPPQARHQEVKLVAQQEGIPWADLHLQSLRYV